MSEPLGALAMFFIKIICRVLGGCKSVKVKLVEVFVSPSEPQHILIIIRNGCNENLCENVLNFIPDSPRPNHGEPVD